jgi:hypothetical protein
VTSFVVIIKDGMLLPMLFQKFCNKEVHLIEFENSIYQRPGRVGKKVCGGADFNASGITIKYEEQALVCCCMQLIIMYCIFQNSYIKCLIQVVDMSVTLI